MRRELLPVKGSSGFSFPALACEARARRLRVQPHVRDDLLDRWPIHDGRDALQLPAAAAPGVLQFQAESPRAQLMRFGHA